MTVPFTTVDHVNQYVAVRTVRLLYCYTSDATHNCQPLPAHATVQVPYLTDALAKLAVVVVDATCWRHRTVVIVWYLVLPIFE